MASKSTTNEQQAPAKPELSNQMPIVPSKVLAVDIPIYNDEACTQQAEDGSIIILYPLDPEDSIHELDVMPTTLQYEVGQYVHFRTNQHKMWETAWFRNPFTGKVEQAWAVVSAEFVGDLIEDSVVAKHQDRVNQLESETFKRFPLPTPEGTRQAEKAETVN